MKFFFVRNIYLIWMSGRGSIFWCNIIWRSYEFMRYIFNKFLRSGRYNRLMK
jgi:hypothetical protein